ncbi:hypothetical protein DRQ53_03475 [bacterium]|nr:MAG: hypothetical protein DRQ53_03475 [bacterium]
MDLGLGLKGTRIGQYELLRVLGRGAFGEVWLAHDERLGRQVAIKRLKPEVVGDADARRRFDIEAKLLIAISEPHVVHVLDRIEIEGAPALVTEYMEGGSLSDLKKVRQAPFAIDEVERWAEQAALGLAVMHRRGILHRDIKPANLFLSRDGNLSIGDFGLARDVETTQTLGLQGTMPYMSPEQIRGAEIDARSDLFALGVAIYELLTGKRPFGNGLDRMERLPSARSERPEVPSYLSDVVDDLLEPELDKRIQSADAMLERLRGASPRRSIRLPGKRSIVAFVPILVAVVLGVGMGRCWIPGVPWCATGTCELDAPAGRRIAMLPFEYRGDPAFARLATEIPSLVAARLDGVGRMSAPAPDTFVDCPVDPSLLTRDSGTVSGWMEARQATMVVHGVIIELSGQLRIDLTFRYESERNSIYDKQSIMLEQSADALPAVNEVGLEVLRHLLIEPRDDLAREALAGVSSLEAMCAYLQGREFRRATDFEQAIAIDSTMTIAYYERALLADWNSEGVDVQQKFLRAARRHAGRVGLFGQHMLEAAELELADNTDAAEATLLDIVSRYPRSPSAWMRLANLHYQHNASRGKPWWASRREFEAAEQLGASGTGIYLSFVKTAAGNEDYMRELTADRTQGGAATVNAFTIGSQAMRDSVLTATAGQWCGSGFAWHNIYILVYPDNHHNALAFFEAHICDEDTAVRQRPADEAWLALTIAHLNAGMGRWEEARQWFDRVPVSFRPWRLVYEGLALSLPFIPASGEELGIMISELERWRPQENPVTVDPEQFGALEDRFNPHLGVHEHLRQYCLAALNARAGNIPAAREALSLLQALITRPDDLGFVADLIAMGEGRIALSDEDHAAALAHFERVTEARYGSGGYSSFFQRADARYLRAECLVELGRPEEALGWYEAADQAMEFLLIYSGMAHFGQAQALEQLGREPEAMTHYRVFLDLYEQADTGYAQDIDFALARLAELRPALPD